MRKLLIGLALLTVAAAAAARIVPDPWPRPPVSAAEVRRAVTQGLYDLANMGAIAGDEMLYIADGQWERYGPGGALTDGLAPRPTSIRRTIDLIPPIVIGGADGPR